MTSPSPSITPAPISPPAGDAEDAPPAVKLAGLPGGVLLAAAALWWAHPALGGGAGLDAPAAWALAVLVLMATWWMTMAVDLAVTALLPVLLFPLLGVGSFRESAAPYADNIIFLFAGGAALGLALERTSVSMRFAVGLMRLAGSRPAGMVAALLTASALVSAWVSNTATAAMMLPVALGAGAWVERHAQPDPLRERAVRNFRIAALLAVAYGASAGGLLTLIGSPPNAIAADWLDQQDIPVDFARWMGLSLPIVLVFGPVALIVLLLLNPIRGLKLAPPSGDAPAMTIEQPMGLAGWLTLAVLALAATAWVAHPFITAIPKGVVTDGAIAIAAAVLVFLLPGSIRPWKPILGPEALRNLPWGVLVLFGGGLSLAEAMQRTGLSSAIGESFSGLNGLPPVLVVCAVVAALVFASEIASNTALTATAVPIVGAMAPALGVPPEKLVIPAAYGASYAFMLPVGTPPNAMAFATGMVPLPRMLRTGFVLNLAGILIITAATSLLL